MLAWKAGQPSYLGPGPEDLRHERLPLRLSVGFIVAHCLALLVSIHVLGLRLKRLDWRSFDLEPLTPAWAFGAVSVALLCLPVAGVAVQLAQRLTHDRGPNPQVEMIAPEGFSWEAAISMILVVGLLTPFCEELLFRGIVFRWLRRKWGFAAGAVVSSLLFGMLHIYPQQVAATALLGLAAAWVYERSGSLWAPVVVHAVYNSVQIAVLYTLLAGG